MLNAKKSFRIYKKAISTAYKDFIKNFLENNIKKYAKSGYASFRIFICAEDKIMVEKCMPYILKHGYKITQVYDKVLFYTDDNLRNKGLGIPYLSTAFNKNAESYRKAGGYTYEILCY